MEDKSGVDGHKQVNALKDCNLKNDSPCRDSHCGPLEQMTSPLTQTTPTSMYLISLLIFVQLFISKINSTLIW
jgi:hypothetical protein